MMIFLTTNTFLKASFFMYLDFSFYSYQEKLDAILQWGLAVESKQGLKAKSWET